MTKDLNVQVPAPRLRQFIKLFWIGEDEHTESFGVVPDGCVDLVMRCSGKQTAVTQTYGSSTQYNELKIAPSHRYIGLRFQPGQAAHFTDVPVFQLTNTFSDEYSAFTASLGVVMEQETHSQVFEQLNLACWHWLSHCPPKQDYMDEIISKLIQQPFIRLSEFCKTYGVSERKLQRHFQHRIGLSPKMFLRIQRAHNLHTCLNDSSHTPLSEMAYAAGYSDQSHMQREIKLFFGQTPKALKDKK